MSTSQPRIVVIPARNEASTIEGLVRAALVCADAVIVANDGSTDATRDAALIAGADVVDVPRSRPGMAGVYATGLLYALARFGPSALIVEMDAGGSHDPSALPHFWAALQKASVATGTRFGLGVYEGKWQRRWLSLLGTWLTNLLHGTRWTDATSGFIGYRAHALRSILEFPLKSRGHFYQTEMRLRAHARGFSMVEVPIVYRNSGSSLNWRSIREALRLVFSRD